MYYIYIYINQHHIFLVIFSILQLFMTIWQKKNCYGHADIDCIYVIVLFLLKIRG